MQKYDILEQIGEGTYGIVLKCRNKETNEIVAIKRFKEPADPNDPIYLKITTREVRMLRQSKHPFVVNILEAFKRKTKTFLIFEYCESTVLQLIEERLFDKITIKIVANQLLIALQHLHKLNIIHRDIKPENLLLQFKQGKELGIKDQNIVPVLKLCDFGFARQATGQQLTEYVATRWYRAPELIIGDNYDFSVDIWAFGLVLYEMVTGEPLIPGDTDLDMIYRMQQFIGPMCPKHQQIIFKTPRFQGIKLSSVQQDIVTQRLSGEDPQLIELIKSCLQMDPNKRIQLDAALDSSYFDEIQDLNQIIQFQLSGIMNQSHDFSAPVLQKVQQPIRSKSSFVGKASSTLNLGSGRVSCVQRQVIPFSKQSSVSPGSDYYINKPPNKNSLLKTTNRYENTKQVQKRVMQTYGGLNLPGIRRK
ncbi:Kinase, CMGC CDKL [Spironucleus salmonicida]|uniref:cyclin-dependent kinase n=1 Tax=Spironucleus salmonicida TaxID=348837 RepID=V6LH94_9EUKA|nr:Kinase, CMGC CDKL [Spironucleus salmonicida]|eukprot:EST43935.1 Kinase, CMGC CDKL [Spironucleus salmonicida]